jgi:2-methylisocitrate lyase-like PEP mutase family enzyme
MDTTPDRRRRAEEFRAMHHEGRPLLLANVWDAGSAALLSQLPGVRALATTSAGLAAAQGLPDGERLTLDQLLPVLDGIARSTALPWSVDLEAGYGGSTGEVADSVTAVLERGALGVNLEDGDPAVPGALLDARQHAERVAAARDAADRLGVPALVNARTDTYWRRTGPPDTRLAETVRRMDAYRAAGADCLFVPGFPDPALPAGEAEALLGELVAAAEGVPLNVLWAPGLPDLETLGALGVARVTVGSGLYRVALGAAREAMAGMLATGGPEPLRAAGLLSYPELAEALAAAREAAGKSAAGEGASGEA